MKRAVTKQWLCFATAFTIVLYFMFFQNLFRPAAKIFPCLLAEFFYENLFGFGDFGRAVFCGVTVRTDKVELVFLIKLEGKLFDARN